MAESACDPELLAKQAELERLNRLYAMLSNVNRTIVRAEVPQELYAAACRIAVEDAGFGLAWVSLLDPTGDLVEPVAAAGVASVSELRRINEHIGGSGPTALAVRANAPYIVNDISAGPDAEPWQIVVECWGVGAGASFPLRQGGDIVGAFNVAAAEPGFFREAEVNLLNEVADDLSFALDVMRREEQRRAGESKMEYLANYDSQTGLPSRAMFDERLAAFGAEQRAVAVLVVNLRNYHNVVQLHGPAAGLEIMRSVAVRLETAAPSLLVARVADAEFAVALPDPPGLHLVEEQAWRIHRPLAESVRVGDEDVFLDPFVGIAVAPQDGDVRDLLDCAKVAAATMVQDTTSSWRFYRADMQTSSRRRFSLDAALRRALERDEFVLHYQPQVDMASGRLTGAEALLRWERPGHGLVPPKEFIPVLEDNGMISVVGEWVLLQACRRTRSWQDDGMPPFRLAVNLSARQFHEGAIRPVVRGVLALSKLDPEWLELEITEGIVMRGTDNVIRTMRELRADGVSHALDDFGTGYSSLSYLQRLPVERIKIDRSFVTHITSNPSDAAIARGVIGMAHSLGMSVVAEGVETEAQRNYLHGLGCEALQGYLFSPPLPETGFAQLLAAGRGLAPAADAHGSERLVLIVDDEPNILSALDRVLHRKGFRVLTATTASAGFDLLATQPVGVVVCDQRMPEMTGTEFLRRVKDLHPGVVRVVLSGYTELNSVLDAVNRGAVFKFITKPWDDATLVESLNDAFRLYELERQHRETVYLPQDSGAPHQLKRDGAGRDPG
jgi:EAL domain-containing protein (putative c-di-GMP-specific phosphodiesterase class I)/PleD family two-component response regulator